MKFKNKVTPIALTLLAASSFTGCAASVTSQTTQASVYGYCSQVPKGMMTDFNVFVSGNLTQPSSDTEGRMAVGGNVFLAHYSVGYTLPKDPTRFDLVVGGNLQFNSGAVESGAAAYGGIATITQAASFYGGIHHNPAVVDFAQAQSEILSMSSYLSGLAPNGSVETESWSSRHDLKLTGTDSVINVFSITTDDLTRTHGFYLNAPPGSTALINVRGASAQMHSFAMFLNGISRDHVVFHFPDATELYMSHISVEGSVIAPHADVNYPTGQLNGHFIAKSMTGMGQFNHVPFVGCVPDPDATPPTTTTTTSTSTSTTSTSTSTTGTPGTSTTTSSTTTTTIPTPPTGSEDCTRTIGYWKTHPEMMELWLPQQLGLSGGYRTLLVLNTHIGVSVLKQDVYGHPDNGITKLYAQLLAAKLNVQKGASSTSMSTVIYQSDAFLSSHNPDHWNSLSSSDQTTILAWHYELDQFNNGNRGPAHCQ